MNNFKILLKMISKNGDLAMPESGSKAKVYRTMGVIAISCIMLPCCFVVGYIVFIMTAALIEAGGMAEGLNLVIQLMSVFGVIFSIMVIFNLLYFSSDLEHLLPLPVRPGELVAAKFTHAFFAESVMEFMILFCGFIGYFVAVKINIVSVITAVFGVFLLPLLPLVYCGLYALIVMAFFSRHRMFRNVDLMVAVAVLLFLGLFIWSFAQMDSVNIENYIDSLRDGSNVFIKIMNTIFFTVPVFLKALEGGSVLYLLLFVGLNVICASILFALGNRLYLRGVYMVSSAGKKSKARNTSADEKAFVQKTPFAAYLGKEIKTLNRTPAYRKYCVLVNLIWPVLIVAVFKIPATKDMIMSFRDTYETGFFLSDVIVLMTVIGIAFFATAMNSIAATSFTREGKHLSFVKHIPLNYSNQLKIKVCTSMLYSGITVIVSTIVLCALMGCDILRSVYFLMIGIICAFICTYTGLVLDTTHPKLDWEDEYGALRGNPNAFFNMAISILVALVLCIVGYVFFKYTRFPSYMVYTIYLLVLCAILFVLRKDIMMIGAKNIDTDLYSK